MKAMMDRNVDAKMGETPWFEYLIARKLNPQSKVTMVSVATAFRSK
jgi:hypothetical protein